MPRQKPSKTQPKSPTASNLLSSDSAFEPFRFEGRDFYVKRDDLLHPLLSGNKYRKLFTLIETPKDEIASLVSYGGIQSNAMLSIAALCNIKGWCFEYTTKTVPSHLKKAPVGNYARALALGMQVQEVPPLRYEEAVQSLKGAAGKKRLVPQGGADPAARRGVEMLADEIRMWKRTMGIARLTVVTPSGTGTTAAYLASALPQCRVLTVAAVGTPAYLRAQIRLLMPLPPNLTILPTPFRFAQPDPVLLDMYCRLKEAGIEFDLIYAPVMWHALGAQCIDGEILYVHSGGLSGNETMLARYEWLKERLSCG